jgi:hypothetical protein
MSETTFFSFVEEIERENNLSLPLFLKYATECKTGSTEGGISPKVIKVDFYSTDEKICHDFYKPISKIIKKQTDENG